MSDREEFITGLRQLADFLTVNPGVPVPPRGIEIQLSAIASTDDENVQAVDGFALATGVEPVWSCGGAVYDAALRFGPVRYFMHASTKAHHAEYLEEQRLGREAMAAKKAAERQDEADWEAYADCVDCLTPDAVEVLRAVSS